MKQPNQNLRQIGPGVPDLLSDLHTNREYYFIYIDINVNPRIFILLNFLLNLPVTSMISVQVDEDYDLPVPGAGLRFDEKDEKNEDEDYDEPPVSFSQVQQIIPRVFQLLTK